MFYNDFKELKLSALGFGTMRLPLLPDGKTVDPLLYTYERVWTAPFDISGSFRTLSAERTIQLEKAVDNKKSFFIKENKLSSASDRKR